ncbi:hypothetical protein MRX96_022860 [Rhipicephalus microplus]
MRDSEFRESVTLTCVCLHVSRPAEDTRKVRARALGPRAPALFFAKHCGTHATRGPFAATLDPRGSVPVQPLSIQANSSLKTRIAIAALFERQQHCKRCFCA